ncbi:uncharacterized protein BDV14DRAFT_172577 [Aspergillus stella-maris]|uniref:uncharacterized protein n=1 Tax=Aspergillus stella-maris TaxID=1810926 RepID=UPI003CCDF026
MTPLITNPTAEDDQFPVVYWKKRFDVRHPSPHPYIATLDIEYNELAKAWRRLQELLPLSDQVPFEERPQTAQDVQTLLRDIQADWTSSQQQRLYSHSAALCDVFSVTVDAHTKLLTVLSGHQFYSSLFYGTLQSIIKASSGYPRVMNGVMKALTKVNQSIYLDPEQSQQRHLTNESIPSIAHFYSHVFFFLGELMDWYARRFKCRLLQSHHENVYLDFRNLVSTVRNTTRDFMHDSVGIDDQNESDGEQSDALMRNADLYLWERARLSQIGRRNIDRRFAAQNALTRLLIWEIQRSAEERSHLREQRGHLLLRMSNAASQQLQPDGGERDSCVVCLTTAPGQDLLIPATPSEKHRHKYSRVELQAASAHLQEHFNHADQLPIHDAGTNITVEGNVVEILNQWATDTYSQVLAIGSSSNTTGDSYFPSSAGQISSCYASLAAETNAPIITFFCSPRPAPKDGMTEFQQGLIALVYSLIRQLLEYLPPVLNGSATHTVKAENFTLLDGTLTSWKEILSLIDTLLYYAPPLLMCIVDGLDRLSDPSTDEYIRSLVRIFVSHTRNPDDSSPGRQSVLKILFTVEGELEALFQTLAENPLTLTESNAIERSAPPTPLISDVEGDVSVEIAVDA